MPGEGPGVSGLNAYEVALLNGGKLLAVNAALANLVREKAMLVVEEGKKLMSMMATEKKIGRPTVRQAESTSRRTSPCTGRSPK